MKCNRCLLATTLMFLLITTIITPVNSDDPEDIHVEVLIDFGNGIVEWGQVSLGDNCTAIKATELACEAMDLSLDASWSQWGVFIYAIGGKATPFDWSWWWSLWQWNHTTSTWEASWVGANDLILEDGDIIAWSPNSSTPLATPSMRYPWTAFHYDAYNSGNTEGEIPSPNVVSWAYDTGTIEMAASSVVADGKVIVNNWAGVFCLDQDGALLWKNQGVIGGFSPSLSGDMVYVGGKDGYLYALNLDNGSIQWSTEITSHPGLSGVASSPTIVNNRIYTGAFNFSGGPGSVFCLNKDSGQVVWETATPSSVYFSSPCVTEDRVYVGLMGLYNSTTLQWAPPYGVYCFDAGSGQVLWNVSTEGSVGSSPAITGSKLLFTSKDGYLYCMDATNGNILWEEHIGDSVSTPAISQDSIFVGSGEMSNPGKFYQFDLSGNKLWEFQPNGAVQSSPAVVGDRVYFATNVQKGTIYCLSANNGAQIWNYTPYPNQYIISSPAMVNGKLYIGCDNGRLYCFENGPSNITVDDGGTWQTIELGGCVSFHHRDEVYEVNVTQIGTNVATLGMDPLGQVININVSETKDIDTDDNGKADLSITLNSVDTAAKTATLTLATLEEQQDEDSPEFPIFLLILIIVVITVIAGIVLALKRD